MAANRPILTTSTLSQETSDTLQTELAAMQDIASILGQLDEPTRARVLHWAQERFNRAEPVASPAPLHVVSGPRPVFAAREATDEGADESLSVAALDDLFKKTRPQASKTPVPAAVRGQSVTGMLHDFVAEFQDVVREWNVACDGPVNLRSAEPVRSVAS